MTGAETRQVRLSAAGAERHTIDLPGGVCLTVRTPDSIDWRAAQAQAERIIHSIEQGSDAASDWFAERFQGFDFDQDDRKAMSDTVFAVCMARRIIEDWNVLFGAEGETPDGAVTEERLRLLFRQSPLAEWFVTKVNQLSPIMLEPIEGNG
jgi:hypothetical protein